jgi:prepilin-type N-terminal cleavage/methylation domain-containing protein
MPILNRTPSRARPRRGFTLAEIIVAMTLLSIVLLSMARMSVVVSKRGRTNAISAKRTFAMIEEANKFGAMPYDTLNLFSTANATLTAGDFTYTRRLARTTTGTRITLKIAIVPSADTTMVDSVWVYRSKPAQSPLCTGC